MVNMKIISLLMSLWIRLSIILFIYYTAKWYITIIEKEIIIEYKAVCEKYIYDYIITDQAKIKFGVVLTQFGEEEVYLKSAFYDTYITNKAYIMNYINILPWTDIIRKYHYNTSIIQAEVFKTYCDYILTENKAYDSMLLFTQNSVIHNTATIICNDIDTISLFKRLNIQDNMMLHIQNIIKNVEWSSYIKSRDYQSGQFSMLKQYCYEQVRNIYYSTTIDNYDSLDKYSWFDLITYSMKVFAFGLGIVKNIPKLTEDMSLLHIKFTNFLQGLLLNENKYRFFHCAQVRRFIQFSLDLVDGYYLSHIRIHYSSFIKNKFRKNRLPFIWEKKLMIFVKKLEEKLIRWWMKK